MPFVRTGAVLLAVVALLFSSSEARAQAVTGILGKVVRLEPDGSSADSYATGNPHPGGVPENVVNYEDCEANLSYAFTLTLSGTYANYDLVAWAGPDDCTAAAARQPGSATCWPLTSAPIPQSGAVDDAGAPTTTFKLSMRDLAAYAGVSTPISTTYTGATSSVCSAQTQDTQTSIAIYFFFTDHVGVGDAIGVAQAYPVVVDTRAQTIGQTGFNVQQQLDAQLTVSITVTADPDTVTYNVYCDPPPGQETAVNEVPYDAATNGGVCPVDSGPASDGASGQDGGDAAGVLEDASGDAAGGVGVQSGQVGALLDDAGGNSCGVPLGEAGVPSYGSCSPGSVLQPGGGTETTTLVAETDDSGVPVTNEAGATVYVEAGVFTGGTQTLGIPAKNLCGYASPSNPTATITGLRDGYYYTIAVAAVDSAGNVGPLATTCGEPVQLADFWYNYTTAGGQAGGGYCSAAEGVGVPAGTGGLGLLMVASIIAIVRKRRR
jgi:hypothetical protein